MGVLDGKVAIVTGAAGAIGSETVRALGEAGARVVMTDLADSRLEEVASGLRASGFDVAHLAADITDEEGVRAVVAVAMERFGRLDVLDNNAGATGQWAKDGDVADLSLEFWNRMIAVNATGPMLLCKHALPHMVAGGGGSVVNISSGQSLSGDTGNFAYAAGKAALNAMTRHIATSYGPRGVRCNAIAAGLIVPPGAEGRLPSEVQDIFVGGCLVERLGTPRDIANAVVFLASDLSAYITGQVIAVDGGFLAHLPTVRDMRAWMSNR